MLIWTLKSKIAYAKVSAKQLFYAGSITIDLNIMKRAHLRANEKVDVVNLNNGERLTTYVIAGTPDSGEILLNGPAARKCEIGDYLFILSYILIDPDKEHYDPHLLDCGI